MSTATRHPNHLRNRLAMARRFATRIETLAVDTNRDLADVVADLIALPTESASAWWASLATITGERQPSDATVSATIAILAERA